MDTTIQRYKENGDLAEPPEMVAKRQMPEFDSPKEIFRLAGWKEFNED
jgi:hypothetical protein